MPKINSLEVVHQDTNKDGFDNLHDLLVSLKGSANKEVIDGQARAAYETLLEMYVNDKEAFARRLETLTAEFGTSIAQVLEEWTVYASATEAYAKKIEEVSAKAFQNEAKVTEEMYARVTADEAIAKLVTTLRADFESAQTKSRAAIREEQIARANADEALASRSFVMEASIAENNALILEEQTVRATADEALAGQLTTLSATAGSKNKTYYQSTAPTGSVSVPLVSGDLWIDLDDNKLYRYSGTTWVAIQDKAIGVNTAAITSEATARADADTAIADDVTALTARLDTGDFATVKTQAEAGALKNKTYKQATAPYDATGTDINVGDIWYNTTNDTKTYRYASTPVVATVSSVNTSTEVITTTAAHGFSTGDVVLFNTTGSVIGSLTNNASYYIIKITSTSFKLATTYVNADDGTAINLSSAGTGTRTFTRYWEETTDTRIATTYARWGVQVDANGNVAGIQLNSDSSGTSAFTVVANNFKVYGSGGQESIQNPIDVSVIGNTQRVGIGNAMIVYYEGTDINRWAAINNIKASGVYARPTASDLTALPYSWANNGSAGLFAGNADSNTGENYHGLRGAVFNNNNPTSILSRGIVGSHTGHAFYAEIGGSGSAPFTGGHEGAVYKNTELNVGEIVVDDEILIKADISNTFARVVKSSMPNQRGVIGVVSLVRGPLAKVDTLAVIAEHRVDDGFGNLTGPLTAQYDAIKDYYDIINFNALGEGQILVCGENGNISRGDLIVTSSVGGVGMKQDDDIIRSYTVAKAREDITFEDNTTPKLVSCIYLCG